MSVRSAKDTREGLCSLSLHKRYARYDKPGIIYQSRINKGEAAENVCFCGGSFFNVDEKIICGDCGYEKS